MTQSARRIIVFGEVLHDLFPDGQATLGGAALNAAWNLKGLGLDPLFVSRVGEDERGERVLTTMREWGMDTSAVQVDGQRPTGIVRVTLDGGSPSYEIVPEQAYDFIDAETALAAVGDAGSDDAMLYHGTLAARSPVSRACLDALRARGFERFVDVNLREPWYEPGAVLGALEGAETVKLNDEELLVLNEEGDLGPAAEPDLESLAREFRERTGCGLLVVTRGAEGAVAIDGAGKARAASPRELEKSELVDTVGAGDAFSAALMAGLVGGEPVAAILDRSVEFARSVCTLRGATSTERTFYGG